MLIISILDGPKGIGVRSHSHPQQHLTFEHLLFRKYVRRTPRHTVNIPMIVCTTGSTFSSVLFMHAIFTHSIGHDVNILSNQMEKVYANAIN